jgi:spore coat protein U-like protein
MKIKTIVAASALSLVSFGASAVTKTADLAVSATVIESCEVTTAAVAFGNYDASTGLAVDNTGSVDVICSSGTTYDIGLGAGTGATATVSTRQMGDAGTGVLNYALYKDSGRLTNWDDTGLGVVSGTGNGSSQSHPVYGRIAADQAAAPAGAYTDTVVVTVTYGV